MAYRLTYSDYAGNTASPSPPTPTPAPAGNGYRLRYSDYPGTAEGPPDPARWEGPPGPAGPAGPPGPSGPAGPSYTLPTASTTILGGVKIDGSSITISDGTISSAATSGGPFLPLAGGYVTGPTDFAATIQGTTFETYTHRIQTGGTLNTALGIYGDLSGTQTGGNSCFARINLKNDTLAAGGAGLTTLLVDQHSGGTGTTGNRIGAYVNFNFAGGTTNKGLGYGDQYGGLWVYATASGNVGGATGGGNAYGSLWGGISSATLAAGATFWTHVMAHEFDFGVSAGASATYVQGLKVALAHHAQATQATDYMIGLAKVYLSDVALGNGIVFGSVDGYWPIAASGTLIGTQASFLATPPPMSAANGIDLSAVTFTGAAFKSAGFAIDGAGAISAGPASFTTLTASGTVSGAGFTALLSPYALSSGVPAASSTTPVMDGTATIGVGTTWARADHIHPTDTSRYAAANPSGYQTAANVTTALAAGQPGAFSTLSASSTVSGVGFTNYLASPQAIGGTTPSTGKFTTVQSTIATGTAPLIVASTTNVANLNASSLNGATFAAPGAIGGTTAAAGTFTTLNATSTTTLAAMTSTGITASPISGSTGSFTTLAASSTVSGTGFSTYLASPPAIGATAASSGAFTTLSASSTVSGTGFSTYLASPPAIGGTIPAAGAFTTLSATGTSTLATITSTGGTMSGGLGFGSTFASSTSDLTRHLTLYGTGYGLCVTSGALNINAGGGGAAAFNIGGTSAGYINSTGLNMAIGQQTAFAGSFTTLAASSTVSGAGFSTYLASPPAIGGTAAAAGTFTTLAASAQILSLPAAKAGTSYTVAATDRSLILAPTGTFTLTLPTASTNAGRILVLKLTAAFAVNSASANVVPMVGGSAVTAILVATAGKYAELQSDGTNWQIMSAN